MAKGAKLIQEASAKQTWRSKPHPLTQASKKSIITNNLSFTKPRHYCELFSKTMCIYGEYLHFFYASKTMKNIGLSPACFNNDRPRASSSGDFGNYTKPLLCHIVIFCFIFPGVLTNDCWVILCENIIICPILIMIAFLWKTFMGFYLYIFKISGLEFSFSSRINIGTFTYKKRSNWKDNYNLWKFC